MDDMHSIETDTVEILILLPSSMEIYMCNGQFFHVEMKLVRKVDISLCLNSFSCI